MTDQCNKAPTLRLPAFHLFALLLVLALSLGAGSAAAQSQATSDVHPATPKARKEIAGQHPQPGSPVTPPAATTTNAKTSADSAAADQREATRMALKAPKPDQFRPNGAVIITANHAELVQGNYAVYTGKVKVRSDTLNMDGDRLELRHNTDGQYMAKITGDPAHMNHAGVGPADPPVTAHGQTIDYDSAAGTIKLDGKAQLTRGGNSVDGDEINYDMNQQRVQAVGSDSGQVKMVIQPPPRKNAPAATDGATP